MKKKVILIVRIVTMLIMLLAIPTIGMLAHVYHMSNPVKWILSAICAAMMVALFSLTHLIATQD